MRYLPHEVLAYEVPTHEMPVHEVPAHDVPAHEMPATSIYTIYGLLHTTSGLGVRHTGPACQTAGLLGSLQHVVTGSADGVVGNKMTKLRQFGIENQVFLYALGDEGNCNFTPNALNIYCNR